MSKNVTITLGYDTWITVMSALKIVETERYIRRTKEHDEDIKFAHFTIQTALVNSNLSPTIQESEPQVSEEEQFLIDMEIWWWYINNVFERNKE